MRDRQDKTIRRQTATGTTLELASSNASNTDDMRVRQALRLLNSEQLRLLLAEIEAFDSRTALIIRTPRAKPANP